MLVDTDILILKTEMAEGESAAVIGPTRLPASRVASSYRCNRCEPGSLVEPSTTPSSSLSIPVSRLILAEEVDEVGEVLGDFGALRFTQMGREGDTWLLARRSVGTAAMGSFH